MPIIKEQQNWDTEKIINMHTIIQTTMSDSSIYLMSCPEESFISRWMGYEVKIKEHMQRIRREAAKTEQKPQDGAEQ